MKGTVLIVDDQQEYARFLNKLLTKFNYQTQISHSAHEARIAMSQFCPDVVLMDKNLPDADGIELVAELKKVEPNTQFIVITGHASIKSAVLSAKRGAVDYLAKPCEIEEVLLSVDNAMSKKSLTEEVQLLRSKSSRSSIPATPHTKHSYKSEVMKQALQLATRASKQKGPLMLVGESGSGKERLARWIHYQSKRAQGPFFSINLAAFTQAQAEVELFGHEPGAYKNTHTRKKGLLELADGGTLLINELESMDLSLQAKLLNFFENRSILRLGGERLVSLDTRIFVTCRAPFGHLVESGHFLSDLYYRINVLPIHLPPLRERKEDIVQLAAEILDALTSDLGFADAPTLTPAAKKKLSSYRWPGNIRELRNVLERTLLLGNETEIDDADLPLSNSAENSWHISIQFPEKESLHDVTKYVAKQLIEEALRRGKTKQEAARLLGLSRHALAHQMKALETK